MAVSKNPKKTIGFWREAARALEHAFPETHARKPLVVDLTSDGPSIVYSILIRFVDKAS